MINEKSNVEEREETKMNKEGLTKVGEFNHKGILAYAKEVKETRSINELTEALASGDWIATMAVQSEPPLYVLIRVQ